MIRFNYQKSYDLPGTPSKVFFLLIAFALLKSLLLGQEKIDYRGVWQTETTDSDSLFLILKRNQLASYFWAEDTDPTVYQGSWNESSGGATLTWNDGSTHQITRSLLSYTITHSDASGNIIYEAPATRLSEDILGQWAKAPLRPEDQTPEQNKTRGFFGTWKIEAEAAPYYLVIEPDRSAATSWNGKNSNNVGLRGSWAKQGSELHIAWDTGHYGILRQNERNFSFQLIAPGSVIEKDTSKKLIATRISSDSLQDKWQEIYINEKSNQPGSVKFKNRLETISFYRGSWIIQRSGDTFELIEIGRFGGLKTSADNNLYGSWRTSGQDIFMNWDDGMRQILKSVGNGFLIYEYKSGRPIDGVPTRIFSVAPENTRKLDEYMKGRKEVALDLINSAVNAGAISSTREKGWAQQLTSWAWPFGNDNDAQPSGTLLRTEPETTRRVDPWWWPFWSENPPTETLAESNSENRASEALDSKNLLKVGTVKPSKADWDWPF